MENYKNIYRRHINIDESRLLLDDEFESALLSVLTKNLHIPKFYINHYPSEILSVIKRNPSIVSEYKKDDDVITFKENNEIPVIRKNKIYLYLEVTASELSRQQELFSIGGV